MRRKKFHAFRSDRVYLLPEEMLHLNCPTCAQVTAAICRDPYGRRTIPPAILESTSTLQHLEHAVLGRVIDWGDPTKLGNIPLDDDFV